MEQAPRPSGLVLSTHRDELVDGLVQAHLFARAQGIFRPIVITNRTDEELELEIRDLTRAALSAIARKASVRSALSTTWNDDSAHSSPLSGEHISQRSG